MEDEISKFLANVREKAQNSSANYLQHQSCRLNDLNMGAVELLELVFDKESSVEEGPSNVKQVRVPYTRLFYPQYSEPNEGGSSSREVILLQGEAGVGKTMLCMSIMEEWAAGKHFMEFHIVLFLPLRSKSVASVEYALRATQCVILRLPTRHLR